MYKEVGMMKVDGSLMQPTMSAGKIEITTNKHMATGVELMNKKEMEPYNLTMSEKIIIDTIEKANKAAEGVKTSFQFSIHKQTHQIMVKILNKETKEVIREIPPEKILDMVAKMWEMAGIIVDEKR